MSTIVTATSPTGTALALPLVALAYQLDRYCNRVGAWQVTCAVDDRIDTSTSMPASAAIVTGWSVTIYEEGDGPNGPGTALLTNGIVERREIQIADGGAVLVLSGSTKNVDLVRQQVRGPATYGDGTVPTNIPIATIAADIAGRSIPVPLFSTAAVALTFNGGTKYAALLALGELGRLTLRENWDGDDLEFVAIDGAPDSGWTIVNVENADPSLYGAA